MFENVAIGCHAVIERCGIRMVWWHMIVDTVARNALTFGLGAGAHPARLAASENKSTPMNIDNCGVAINRFSGRGKVQSGFFELDRFRLSGVSRRVCRP